MLTIFSEYFGLSRLWSLLVSIFIFVVLFFTIFWFIHSSPPRTITITSGPAGSSFERYAERYRDLLRSNGVTLKIVESQGSVENLQRLQDPKYKVDIGFVQGGTPEATNAQQWFSLGSIAYQPLVVFYRSTNSVKLLSALNGERIAVGPVGSGTHSL